MPADLRPQPGRETRSSALARQPFLMEAEGEVGQDGWQAAPLGPRLITDTRPRRSPRLKPKTRRSGSGSSGNAARLAPPRARLLSCAPPSFAHPPPLARAAGSQTPRAVRGGRKAVAARRREVSGRCCAALAGKGGRRSELGEAAGGPRRKGCWGPVERAESPARPSIVPLFLCSLRPLLAVVGRGADAGSVPASLRAGCAPPDPELSGA
ncbi:hypothetical protein HJG60_008038 [Phyllostomus discolor]|uniref:Uncharacterized protein n=1 Tax=Phyllostomus discolor TaxID=89673 RepID=A0A834BK25_9CHIR|nr:hypothetical protein HJG60_008038 [Phyllostomus discolor]